VTCSIWSYRARIRWFSYFYDHC